MNAFGAVYGEYHDMVYRFLFRMCRDKSLAEELTEETFYQAMKSWDQYHGGSSVFSWLCAIAKHTYYGSLKRPREVPLDETNAGSVHDIADALLEGDRQMQAQHMLHRLPDPYREVFTLRTFCDLSHGQIGELFGKSGSWARVTYYRARQMLQLALKEAEKQ